MKSTILSSLFISAILLVVFGFVRAMASGGGTCTINGEVAPPEKCAGMVNLISYFVLIVTALVPLVAYMEYKVTQYVVTTKRALLKSGLIGADMRSVYYDQMKSVFVKVGIIGKIFGTGMILIDTGRITQHDKGSKTVYDKFKNVKDPYGVYKVLQETLSLRKETLHSGRADFKDNREGYRDFVQETEKMRKDA